LNERSLLNLPNNDIKKFTVKDQTISYQSQSIKIFN